MDGRSSGSWSKTEPLVPGQSIFSILTLGYFFQFFLYPGVLDCTVLLASTLLIYRSPTGVSIIEVFISQLKCVLFYSRKRRL